MSNTTGKTPTLRQPSPPAPGQPIPLPPDFPIQWDDPADTRLNWTTDLGHFPDPVSPLAFDLISNWQHGMYKVVEHYGLPMRFEARRFNTYFYQTFAPKGLPPEPVLKAMQAVARLAPGVANALQGKVANAMGKKLLDQMAPSIARLEAYWTQELLPEIQTMLATWERFDLRGATLPQLLAHLDHTLSMDERAGEIHSLIGLPYMIAMSEFDELYHDLFKSNGAAADIPAPHSGHGFGAYQLLAGFDNKMLEGDRALWRLSRQALTLPAVQRVLETCAAIEVMAELQKSAEGQAFLKSLDDFLQTHGQRGDNFDVFGAPSWMEDPTPVLKMLKDQLFQPDRDLEVELKALAAERERCVAEARERLKGYPRPVAERFETLLKAAQYGTFLHSEHQFWIDFGCSYQVRRMALEFGRRLAEAGLIEQPLDVFYLRLDELKETARALSTGAMHSLRGSAAHLKTLVRERQAEMEHFRQVQPPPAVGSPPPDAPPSDNAMGRLMIKSGLAPAPTAIEPGTLRGNAGSPGKVRGIVKVVRALSEADKVQQGDILVAEATAPPWTPLFATAAAIVTDVGGVLSHSAVVAREYRIPAVVGTGRATTTFCDGQLLEVDGDAGIVRLVS